MRKFFVLLAALLCVCLCAAAEISLPQAKTAGQQALQDYLQNLNAQLEASGAQTVNSLFDYYTFGATVGITACDDAQIPQDVELTFTLTSDGIETLVLRSARTDNFAVLAGACIQSASPNVTSLQDAMQQPAVYVKKVQKNPTDSFGDTVNVLQGTSPRAYWSYYPDQYHDGRSWLQMTLVFPLPGTEEAGISMTPTPQQVPQTEYQGYLPLDSSSHLDVFMTATPQPDSPAGEADR